MEIDGVSVLLLQAYNENKMDEKLDERFIYFVLESIFTEGEKRSKYVGKNKVDFVRAVFEHRLRNVADKEQRFGKFDDHIKLLVTTIRKNFQKLH